MVDQQKLHNHLLSRTLRARDNGAADKHPHGCLARSAAQPRGSSRHRPSKPSAFPSSRLIRRPVRPHTVDHVASFAILSLSYVVAIVYFRYALLDHRYPTKSPTGLSVARHSLVLSLVSRMALGVLQSDPFLAGKLASVSVGLLAAPAIAPPIYVDKFIEPSFVGRLRVSVYGTATAWLPQKFIALLVFSICALLAIDAWYIVMALVTGFLLQLKSGALAVAEAGGEGSAIPPAILKRWLLKLLVALLCFSLLWAYCPYIVLSQLTAAPESWFAFAGLGIGALLSIFTGFK